VGRRGRRRWSQGRAESRVRGRVRERARDRGQGRQTGRGAGQGRTGGGFDLGDVEGIANRLGDHVGGSSRLAGAASGLAGAASGLAGGSLAHRFLDSNAESSDEDFRREVSERLAALDERLAQLEDQVHTLREGGDGAQGDLAQPTDEQDPFTNS
jgi:hypothetical protein